uniref:Uncharacterized protein n=1 Tax=Ditylenchus dipsaci TaxID=166011 RepID=A0A915DFK2_9BILA
MDGKNTYYRRSDNDSAFYLLLYTVYTMHLVHCKHLDLTVYRLLLWISITDMGILWVLGFAHGILAIQGAVFCSSPNFIYICGLFIRFFWLSESTCEMVLVFNRCLTTLSPRIEKALFGAVSASISYQCFQFRSGLYFFIHKLEIAKRMDCTFCHVFVASNSWISTCYLFGVKQDYSKGHI